MDKDTLIANLILAEHKSVQDTINGHQARQTQAFNFTILVYGAGLTLAAPLLERTIKPAYEVIYAPAAQTVGSAVAQTVASAVAPPLPLAISVVAITYCIVLPLIVFPLCMVFVDVDIFCFALAEQRRRFMRHAMGLPYAKNEPRWDVPPRGEVPTREAPAKLRVRVWSFLKRALGPARWIWEQLRSLRRGDKATGNADTSPGPADTPGGAAPPPPPTRLSTKEASLQMHYGAVQWAKQTAPLDQIAFWRMILFLLAPLGGVILSLCLVKIGKEHKLQFSPDHSMKLAWAGIVVSGLALAGSGKYIRDAYRIRSDRHQKGT